MKELIRKYSNRLQTMKENRAHAIDRATDAESTHMDEMITSVAEFIRDLKSIDNPIPEGHYNEAPEGLIEITLEQWQRGMFHYCIEKSDSKQVRRDGKVFDLRLFDVPNFENKKLGYAVMHDWFDTTTGKNRPEAITRFCRYGRPEDWKAFEWKFNAQFQGDNS